MKKNKKNDVALEPIAEADRVPLKEKLAYGIGGLMDGGGVSMMSCVMLAYMTKNGIAMTVASTIMMLAKLWDAITDPFMGFISDNTRGKWGRRKPYMFFGGISLFICIFFVFLPAREWGMSVGGFTAYIIILYLIWNTCSTVTQVPYCSMASDITPSFRETQQRKHRQTRFHGNRVGARIRSSARVHRSTHKSGRNGLPFHAATFVRRFLALHEHNFRNAVRRRSRHLRCLRQRTYQSQNSETEIQFQTIRQQLRDSVQKPLVPLAYRDVRHRVYVHGHYLRTRRLLRNGRVARL